MELSDKERARLANLKWALYVSPEEAEGSAKILAALASVGHTTSPSRHIWQGKERDMFDISFQAAEFVYDTFRSSKLEHILLRRENCRGWLAYFGKIAKPLSCGTNDSLFSKQRIDRGLRKLRPA